MVAAPGGTDDVAPSRLPARKVRWDLHLQGLSFPNRHRSWHIPGGGPPTRESGSEITPAAAADSLSAHRPGLWPGRPQVYSRCRTSKHKSPRPMWQPSPHLRSPPGCSGGGLLPVMDGPKALPPRELPSARAGSAPLDALRQPGSGGLWGGDGQHSTWAV